MLTINFDSPEIASAAVKTEMPAGWSEQNLFAPAAYTEYTSDQKLLEHFNVIPQGSSSGKK